MPTSNPLLARAEAFCAAYGLRVPILLAPMAGASPASLSIAVANAGGLGSCGALLMQPAAIKAWAAEVRAGSNGGFKLNLWIPDPPPTRNAEAEDAVRAFLRGWGPDVAREAGDVRAARLRRPVRGHARGRADHHLLDHGPLSAGLRRAHEGQGHKMVRQCHDRGRSQGGGGGRRGRDRGPGHGGRRPSRRLRSRQGAGRTGRAVRAAAGDRRRGEGRRWSRPAASPMRAASRRR